MSDRETLVRRVADVRGEIAQMRVPQGRRRSYLDSCGWAARTVIEDADAVLGEAARALRAARDTEQRWACLPCSEAAGTADRYSGHVTHAVGEECPLGQRLRDFVGECAKGPHADSDLASYVEWVTERARALVTTDTEGNDAG